MSSRARHATSLLALAAIAVIVVLFVGGFSSGAAAAACAAATPATYREATLAVALRLAAGERGGTAVDRALHTISSDGVLTRALAAGDDAAVRREMLVLLYNHEHIVRLRVSSGGRLIDDVGGPLVIAPVRGTLRAGGRVVGRFTMSIQDDMGYRLLLARLIGAHSVITYRGGVIMRDIALEPGQLHGASVRHAGRRYLISTLTAGRFPAGTLRVYMLVHAPAAALARSSCAQVRADALATVAANAYGEALGGPEISRALSALARAGGLRSALARGDYTNAERAVRTLVGGGGFARLQVFARGHLVAEAGSPGRLVAPVTLPLRDGTGRLFGSAVFSAQSAHGYADLVHILTGAPALVRSGARQLAGTFAGPAVLPRRGSVTYRGVAYTVASFAGQSYPSGALRVYVLSPQGS